MNAVAELPKTHAAATDMLQQMKSRRSDISSFIENGGVKRRDLALAVQLGGSDEELRKHTALIEAAETERADLNSAIEGLAGHAETLRAKEAADAEADAAANREIAIGDLLDLDDEIDDALDAVRELLQRRREMIAADDHKFLRAVDKQNDVEDSLMSYFDKWLNINRHAYKPYERVVRLAERDGKAFDRVSPRMAQRPPRPRSPYADVLKGGDWAHTNGIDSELENRKFHASGGTRPQPYQHPFDVSGSDISPTKIHRKVKQ